MTINPAARTPLCAHCEQPRPVGSSRYCSVRCRETAKKRRQRARQAGEVIRAPRAAQRRALLDLAEQLATSARTAAPAAGMELEAARARLATPATELSRARVAARQKDEEITRLRSELQSSVKDSRFIATAFARTLTAHGMAESVGPRIRDRVAAWLPEGENPWQ